MDSLFALWAFVFSWLVAVFAMALVAMAAPTRRLAAVFVLFQAGATIWLSLIAPSWLIVYVSSLAIVVAIVWQKLAGDTTGAAGRTLLDIEQDGVIVVNRAEEIVLMNRSAKKMLGYDQTDDRPQKLGRLFSSAKMYRLFREEMIERALTEKKQIGFFEANLVALTGRQVPVSLVAAPLARHGRHSAEGVVLVARNIMQTRNFISALTTKTTALTANVEQLNAEKLKLEAARAKDEALLSSIGDGLVATDPKGKIILANRQAERMFGRETGGLIGLDWGAGGPLYDEHKKLIAPEQQPMRRVLDRGVKITGRYHLPRLGKTGSPIPVHITITPVVLNRRTEGAILIFRDITKEMEIDRAKTEFVSLASHQLRTPLSTINWYAEMLLAGDAGKVTKPQRSYLNEIYRGNQRMVELVNALLNVSRIDLGTFAVEPSPTDIVAMAKSEIDELKPLLLQQKVKIRESNAANIPLVSVDPKLMRIVFQNLLSNAIKYSHERGVVTLKIAVSSAKSGRGKPPADLMIVVSDTGYGIPQSQQDKVFTKLFRADNIKRKETEGTGLGLYVVKSIVDQSKGTITFTSRENKGTTFRVRLPLTGMISKEGTKELT